MGAKRVIVIGGGVAGLAAAYRIKKLVPGVELRLIEAEAKVGGKVVTDRVETKYGTFVVEGGPDTFISYKPAGIALCRELGIDGRLHGTNEKVHGSSVMKKGRLYKMPEGLTGLIPSKFGPMASTRLISWPGKIRMGLDLFVPPKPEGGDETLAEFVRRRLGNELYERLIEPLMSGIYAGDGEQLSLAATFPQLRQSELEHGSLVRGMFATKKKNRELAKEAAAEAAKAKAEGRELPSRKKWPAFVTPELGLAEIVEALEKTFAREELVLGRKATRLTRQGSTWTVELDDASRHEADAVVVAAPAHGAAPLLRPFDPAMAEALDGIPHASTATLTVAYRESDLPKPFDSFGYVIPKAEGRAILAATFTSTKFPHRAPDGTVLVRAFIGRAGNDAGIDLSELELLAMVKDELRDVVGIAAEPIFHRTFRWPLAMPQYVKGHLARLEVIESNTKKWPGLALAGNAYRGIGLPDCIASGEAAAKSVAAYIGN